MISVLYEKYIPNETECVFYFLKKYIIVFKFCNFFRSTVANKTYADVNLVAIKCNLYNTFK